MWEIRANTLTDKVIKLPYVGLILLALIAFTATQVDLFQRYPGKLPPGRYTKGIRERLAHIS